jgi:hypothetical protein
VAASAKCGLTAAATREFAVQLENRLDLGKALDGPAMYSLPAS